MNLTETNCTIEHNGQKFSANGAHVTPDYAAVYVTSAVTAGTNGVSVPPYSGMPIRVGSWHGEQLGYGYIVSAWDRYTTVLGRSRWVSVRFTIDGVTYAGRFNWDNGQLVNGRAVKGGR